MNIIKRDGRQKPFNRNKIVDAILKAFLAVDGGVDEYATRKAEKIADFVQETLSNNDKLYSVEEIQDIVEKGLMATKRKDVAKEYVLYREERNRARGNLIDNTVMELLDNTNEYWATENSNKNAEIVTVQRDYLAGIVSTDISRRKLLPKQLCEAHDEGIIHEHDMDYLLQNALSNCCLINLEDMLMNGTVINGIKIEPQSKLLTATTVATQIITAVASSQYGGTTITLTHLAPYVRSSFLKYKDYYKQFVSDETLIQKLANEALRKEVKDAVQTFNYQINSMSTTNGQTPFISVCMYINENPEYEEETALLIQEFLNQRIKGLQNEKGVYITPAFPKLLYVLDENNTYEGSEYFYLTELAAKCTAKRMVPDYISAKKMREYKTSPKSFHTEGDVYPCMGCRSFLTADRTTKNWAKAKNYRENSGKYYGRFNMGVTTLNLPDIAFSSKGDYDEFWRLFDERAELCHQGLLVRIKRLGNVTSDVAPVLWQHGAFARLDKHEPIRELLHHGYATASLGYAGLYECVKYMTGYSHSQPEGKEFALAVMEALNRKCNEWKEKEDIDYSPYGSPIESTTYKFAKTLKKRFGDDIFIKLDGKDRNYITNSYHIPVFEKINIFDKLSIEAEFQRLSPGGAISYGEVSNLQDNIPAVIQVIQFIYENIMYAELNTKSDYCQQCGYDGEILIDDNMEWYCPNCGCTDHALLNVARRTCGYLGTQFWNYGRTQEIKEREIHLGGNII